MVRRSTAVFYSAYQGLVSKLLHRAWRTDDGMDLHQVHDQVQQSIAAQQLAEWGNEPTAADIAPLALQEFYTALGASELMETNHFFFDADELEIRDHMVMFVEDADETIVWGVPLDQVTLPDPITYRRTVGAEAPDDAGQWESTDATVSELITDILTWNYPEEDVD